MIHGKTLQHLQNDFNKLHKYKQKYIQSVKNLQTFKE